jgi:hypothetical protein
MMSTTRDEPILSWQWKLYPDNHRNRSTLAVHAVTNPLFLAGNLAIAAAPVTSWSNALVGLVVSGFAFALQGRTHRRERVAPEPFLGAGDVVKRVFAEQWITWPRFVLTGGFARAWRAAGEGAAA